MEISKQLLRKNLNYMSDEKESTNPIAGIYSLGVIGYTALFYSQDGFWIALAKSMIWPVYVYALVADKYH